MPITVYERALQIIAVDYTRLYKQLTFPLTDAQFEEAVVRNKTEMMHYAGSTITQGFLVSHVRQCLEVAAAYLSVGADVAPDAMEFGLHLVAFLYYTQPTSGGVPVQISITVPVLECLTELVASRASHLRPVLRALLVDNAIHIAPAVNNSMAMRVVLTAHNLLGAPLMDDVALSTAAVGGESDGHNEKEQWAAYMQASKGIIR